MLKHSADHFESMQKYTIKFVFIVVNIFFIADDAI